MASNPTRFRNGFLGFANSSFYRNRPKIFFGLFLFSSTFLYNDCMPRGLKQLLYGIFYLVIFGAIGYSVYVLKLAPAPTCVDNRQNGIETGAGVAGVCSERPYKPTTSTL